MAAGRHRLGPIRRHRMVAAVMALAVGVSIGATTLTATPGSAEAAPTAPTTLFVVDTSGSMGGEPLDQAKAALTTAVDALVPGQAAGLRQFSGRCGATGTLTTPIGTNNRTELRDDIANLQAGGGTPTPDALDAAAADLAGVTGPKQIVLISDGQSSCGDPCPNAARIAQEQGVGFTIHAVGFNAPGAAEGELQCIARTTGGKYFSVTDQQGLTGAIGAVLNGPAPVVGHEYVAIGDSTTTGFSVAQCREDRERSPFGCTGTPPATPFPALLASQGGSDVDDLNRVGIWGYTIQDAVAAASRGRNALGPWEPQLLAATKASKLVTVNLGINDMDFSDVGGWLAKCAGAEQRGFFGKPVLTPRPNCARAAEERATQPALDFAMNAMFAHLDVAKQHGARVVITKYYNPINDKRQIRFQPDRSCELVHGVAQRLVDALNRQLERRAIAHGFDVVDLGPAFRGHGAGSNDPYVFGTECEAVGLLGGGVLGKTRGVLDLALPPRFGLPGSVADVSKGIQIKFDPHPNGKGTQAQASTVLGAIKR